MTATVERAPAASAAPPPLPRRRRRGRHRLVVLGFLAPALLGFGLFFCYPLVATVFFSFTRSDGLNPPEWVGLRNYVHLLTGDPVARTAAYNTLWMVVVLTTLRVVFALGTASVLARLRSGVGFFRTVFYLPALAPPVAATLAFVFLFNPGTGPVNAGLRAIGIDSPPGWFTDPAWAKPSLTLLMLWCSGELMIIILAALLDVPTELYEAAALDGAGPWSRFRHVTLPSIAPVLLFGVVNSVILSLQFFTQAVVGGSVASGAAEVAGHSKNVGWPGNSTLTFPAWLYQQGFRYFNMGYAAAMCTLLFLVSFACTVVLIRRMRSAAGTGEAR
ncbi:carbohydrate ABC transporter permease [Streptoalloteichus hindustanus]|uniref:Carbohydrate ABC transporter membrane protein 1, CUT1 family n=1 Tax=Streptoalloteichus hindustanus TaxID=2017 RepID=A0A1M4W5W5_STRHI|nr:sugar ABC transporter permease [Streptoalloteichus hindustanus]SHE76616.1 carbohydrate ABC transporter membrane protein 1, CUT1 family [Streptoalloteichus hindustanus]